MFCFIKEKTPQLRGFGRFANAYVISGSCKEKFACVWFGREVIHMDTLYEDMVFVNGSPEEMLYLECNTVEDFLQLVVFDCRGNPLRSERVKISQGVNCFMVPLSGAARLRKAAGGMCSGKAL